MNYKDYGKRIFDFICSSVGLILLSPLLVLIAIFIKLDSKGSVFFFQKRIGKDFKVFKLIKFRSMKEDAEKYGPLITSEGDPRITRIGRILRKTKLDELPQLFNVLKGDMSIVGPRPEVEKYVLAFMDDFRGILKVRPGITDYATFRFRNEEEILKKYDDIEEGYIREVLPEKIRLYKQYINDISFSTDVKLILYTLIRIVMR